MSQIDDTAPVKPLTPVNATIAGLDLMNRREPPAEIEAGHECVECFQPDCNCGGKDERHCNICSECKAL